MDKDKISINQLDVLREVGTMGAGRAATALADLLNEKVTISLPETQFIPLEGLSEVLGDPEKLFFILDTRLEGELGGRISFLLPPQEAIVLGAALLGKETGEVDIQDELFQSSLKEVTNILVGAFMAALSDVTGLTIMYNVPSFAHDMVAALLDYIFIEIAQDSEHALFVKTKIQVKNIDFEGMFLLFPTAATLQRIFQILGVNA